LSYLKKHTFLKLLTLFISIFGILIYLRFDGVYKTIEQRYRLELISQNKSKSVLIKRHLEDAKNDLLYLADIYNTLIKPAHQVDNEDLRHLESTIKPFIQHKKVYTHIKYLNLHGKEILRVNYKDGKIAVVPHGDLQDKSNRYYVKESKTLNPGEVYLSKLDLNVENNVIERPYRSVLRLSTPILNAHGVIDGYVIVSCSGEFIVKELQESSDQIQTALLNKHSFYLYSNNKAEQWGFIYKNGISFKKQHPKFWKQIKEKEMCEFLIKPDFYSCLHLDPVNIVSPNRKSLSRRDWVLISSVNKGVIQEQFFEYIYSLWWMILSVLGISIFSSYLLARYIKALQEVNQRMDIAHVAFQHSSDGVIVLDEKRQIIQVNKAFEKITGYKEEEALLKNPKFLKDPAHKYEKSFFRGMWQEVQEKGFWSGDVYNIKKNGEPYVQHLSIDVVKSDGRITNYIGISSDVTENKRIEANIIHDKDISEKANKAKDIFLTNMSHEIRTPMNAILGFSQLLSKTALNDEQKNFVKKTRNAANSLLSILNDILDLSKISAGKLTIQKAPFKPRRVIRQSIDVLSLQARQKGLALTYEIDENIPEDLIGDAERIRQILINLINNAIKFTEKGSIHINLFVLSKDTHHCVIECSVSDTGIGITDKNLKSLFKQFTQVDNSTTRRKGGTGLGLAISKQLLEAMDGSIEVESEYGNGSTFSFELRLELPESGLLPLSLPQEERLHFNDLNILLVEDNADNCEVATLFLKEMKINVDQAINGKMAIDMIRQKPYDLVLMDIQMPIMDGLDATRILRNEGYDDMPIIAVSAHASQLEKDRSINAGMNAHLVKPFNIQDLQDLLQFWFPDKVFKQASALDFQDKGWVDTLPVITGLDFNSDLYNYWFTKEDFLEKLQQFIQQSIKESERIHKLIVLNEFDAVRQLLHKFKGNVKLYGATRLYYCIVEFEDILKKQEYSKIPDILSELDTTISEFST